MIRSFAIAVALLGMPAAAQDSRIAPPDDQRLVEFERHFGSAMLQALSEGAPADIDALVSALSGAAVEGDLSGTWNCRVIKLGGLTPLVVYQFFRCRITETDEGELMLEKLTGSQLTRGRIIPSEGSLVYLGVGYIAGVEPFTYEQYHAGDIPASAGQVTSDVGFVELVGSSRARVLFPSPILESDFDVLELTR